MIIVLISFFLESILSNYINISTNFFTPLFTITSLIVIYSKFENKYLKICLLFGLLYDLVFTDTLFINMILFLLIGFFVKFVNIYLPKNYINNSIILIIIIIFYRIFIYIIMLMANQLTNNAFLLFKSIYSSLLLNIIYGLLNTQKIILNKYTQSYNVLVIK
ncbi:MAG: rod shape-determining protein MreD [Bacilli bacterium]